MKYARFVSLVAFTAIASVTPYAAAQAAALQQGVSVQMAATSNAVAFPAADDQDAWVIAVTDDGHLFFGVKPVTPEQLREDMKVTPRHRDASVYIKADARASFESVKEALQAVHADLFETAVLLTAQPPSSAQGNIVSPQGLAVELALPSSPATVVHLHYSGQSAPALKVNNQEIRWSGLQSRLQEELQKQTNKLVVVEADGRVPLAQVVKVIDVSRSLGARVAVSLMNSL